MQASATVRWHLLYIAVIQVSIGNYCYMQEMLLWQCSLAYSMPYRHKARRAQRSQAWAAKCAHLCCIFTSTFPLNPPLPKGDLDSLTLFWGLWVEMGSYRENREISVQSADNEHIARRFFDSTTFHSEWHSVFLLSPRIGDKITNY